MDDFEVELCCIFKLVINFSFILMCDQGRSQTSEKDEASLECRRREPLGGSGGMSPQENFEI